MSILKDTLLDYCHKSTKGSRVEMTPDRWNRIREEPNYCSCVYDNKGFWGMTFPLEDILNYVTCKKSIYSFRCRMGYKKIKEMDPSDKLKLLLDYQRHCRYDSSPFGCGSDDVWSYDTVDINGVPYFMTYFYMS